MTLVFPFIVAVAAVAVAVGVVGGNFVIGDATNSEETPVDGTYGDGSAAWWQDASG